MNKFLVSFIAAILLVAGSVFSAGAAWAGTDIKLAVSPSLTQPNPSLYMRYQTKPSIKFGSTAECYDAIEYAMAADELQDLGRKPTIIYAHSNDANFIGFCVGQESVMAVLVGAGVASDEVDTLVDQLSSDVRKRTIQRGPMGIGSTSR